MRTTKNREKEQLLEEYNSLSNSCKEIIDQIKEDCSKINKYALEVKKTNRSENGMIVILECAILFISLDENKRCKIIGIKKI